MAENDEQNNVNVTENQAGTTFQPDAAPQAAVSAPAEAAASAAAPTAVASSTATEPAVKKSKAKYIHYAVEGVLLLALVAVGMQYSSAKAENAELNKQVVALQNNPLLVAERKTNETIQAVARLTAVPAGDTPTVSEVTDAEAVKKSIVGLTDVQNGDKLLFYFKGGKFIQYRPSTDKIVLNQPLNVK